MNTTKKSFIALGIAGAIGLAGYFSDKSQQGVDFLITEQITPDTGMTRSAISDTYPHSAGYPGSMIHFINKVTGKEESFDPRFTKIERVPEVH